MVPMNQFTQSRPNLLARCVSFPGLAMVVCLGATLLVSGCGPRGAEKRVIGTWVIASGDSLGDRMLGPDETLNDKTTSEETASNIASTGNSEADRVGIAVHYLRNGQLVTETQVMGEETTKRGTWKITSQEGDRVEIEFVLGSDEPQQITMLFEDDNTVRMVPPNLAVLKREYVFNKKKKD